MKPAFLFFCFLSFCFSEVSSPEKKGVRNIRVVEKESSQELQTSVLYFKRGEKTLSIYGAVHIAEPAYYQTLNKAFEGYDQVLFEMVGGENLVKPSQLESAGALSASYKLMSTLMKLQGQKKGIDYFAENFLHADLTAEEYKELSAQYGESLMGYALSKSAAFDEVEPSLMLHAMLSGDASKLKRQMMLPLSQVEHSDDEGRTVIIHERNNKALSVMEKVLQRNEVKRVALFYGAAHLSDFSTKLQNQGWSLERVAWLTAWEVKDKNKD